VPAPAYYGPPPYVPRATERRSVGAMVGGIVLVSVGGVMLVGAAIGADVAATDCAFDNCTSSFPGAAVGFLVGGLVAIAVGIPLLIYGARRVPVGPSSDPPQANAIPAWVGAPGRAGWVWHF
jgi:hypothetical protein